MIDAYLDESGIHDGAAICVIAGYFGGRKQLENLAGAWKKVLNDFGFPMNEFHAKDLLGARRHRPMLEALSRTIAAKTKVHPISLAVVVNDFKSFSLSQRKWFTGASPDPKTGEFLTTGCPNKAYFVPFQLCLQKVTDNAPVGGKAHFFFGVDRPFAGYATALFKQVKAQLAKGSYPHSQWHSKGRLGDANFPLASETPQLQAADMFVHLTYQHALERHAANDWSVAPSDILSNCLSNTLSREDHVFQDKECLEKIIETAKEESRLRRKVS
jgi:hypothetical protein